MTIARPPGGGEAGAPPDPSHLDQVEDVVAALTPEQKVDLLSGSGMWRTAALPEHDVPAIVMTDGTYGVRYSVDQIDRRSAGGQDFTAFLAMRSQPDYLQATWGEHKPATCFPNGSSIGCSWDTDLATELGTALAEECRALGVHLLLGPGVNLRRTPLAGRSYEYYSEDPVLSGDLAAALTRALQSGGVGACVKHFACNNSEVERTTMDSVVEERALREVYLYSFERAVRSGRPWAVMSSYNKLNGVQAAQNAWLLTTVLRQEWGFDGVVISDWGGVKDRPASLMAGNDLDMPESEGRKSALLQALDAGEVPDKVVDTACRRILTLVRRTSAAMPAGAKADLGRHHALARRMAAESIVLLKNNGLLPLPRAGLQRVAVVGRAAVEPVVQGTGSATTLPVQLDIPLDELRARLGDHTVVEHFEGYAGTEECHSVGYVDGTDALTAAAVEGCAGADAVIVFAHTEPGVDGEGSDRRHLGLAPGQDELISRLTAVSPNVVVVLANPDAVVMPWLEGVGAVLDTFFSGQGVGGAVADILFGFANPCGKLSVTFPRRVEDVPGFLSYPGENGRHVYSEGIYVGYRAYDKLASRPLFPFGFGLSYTQFRYSGLRLSRDVIEPGGELHATFTVTNTGKRAGAEVVQLYLAAVNPRLTRPPRELRGFAKAHLCPGEARELTISLTARDFEVFDPGLGRWVLDPGEFRIEVGASSRDIRLSQLVTARAPRNYRHFTVDIQPVFALENPVARQELAALVQRKTGASVKDTDRLLDSCAGSFLGIFTTLERYFRVKTTADEAAEVVRRINAGVHPTV